MEPREQRRRFYVELVRGLQVVWPILSVLFTGIMSLGAAVALLEHWSLFDGIYFAFVSSLTIGYGDLAPRRTVSRVLAIGIGLLGVLVIALVAAIAVRAVENMRAQSGGK